MLDDFLVRAALAGVGVALAAAPLGCFVVWRRMAYFGDATSHAALLGVALALAGDLPVMGGVLVVALAMALIVTGLSERRVSTDALLGVLAHAGLAFGLVAISLVPGQRVDLSAYLFGDILAVSRGDLAIIWERVTSGADPADVALAGAADRDPEPGTGGGQWRASAAREADPDGGSGSDGGRGLEGGGRTADCRRC